MCLPHSHVNNNIWARHGKKVFFLPSPWYLIRNGCVVVGKGMEDGDGWINGIFRPEFRQKSHLPSTCDCLAEILECDAKMWGVEWGSWPRFSSENEFDRREDGCEANSRNEIQFCFEFLMKVYRRFVADAANFSTLASIGSRASFSWSPHELVRGFANQSDKLRKRSIIEWSPTTFEACCFRINMFTPARACSDWNHHIEIEPSMFALAVTVGLTKVPLQLLLDAGSYPRSRSEC